MVFLEEPDIYQLSQVQKSLHIEAKEMEDPNNFHCTIRHVKMMEGQTPDKFIDWLNKQQFPELIGFTEKFSMLGEGSLVAELDSPTLHEWFGKVDGWLRTEGGYPPSEFPTYRPHVSLSHETKSPLPTFDVRKDRLKLHFVTHRVTDTSKKVIFEKRMAANKNLGPS